jgi:hypothetical protein
MTSIDIHSTYKVKSLDNNIQMHEKFCSYDDLFISSTNFFIVGHICKYNEHHALVLNPRRCDRENEAASALLHMYCTTSTCTSSNSKNAHARVHMARDCIFMILCNTHHVCHTAVHACAYAC